MEPETFPLLIYVKIMYLKIHSKVLPELHIFIKSTFRIFSKNITWKQNKFAPL